MDAHNAADVILNTVKNSNLNFYIQESPFSLLINLRKTFIKTKNGLPPSSDLTKVEEASAVDKKVKVEKLEEENISLSDSLKDLKAENVETNKVVHELSIKLEESKEETRKALSELNAIKNETRNLEMKLDKKGNENKGLELKNKELQAQINALLNEKNVAAKSMKQRDKELCKLQNKNDNLEEQVRNKKFEINILEDEKKKLVYERKNLEKSLTVVENAASSKKDKYVLCIPNQHNIETQTDDDLFSGSIMRQFVQDFVPTTTISATSPATDIPPSQQCGSKKCEHIPQCILRQPLPPPFPGITFLYNERSNYHKHMMSWTKKEFAGHSRCFSVENENYGCDDCTFLKWWYKWHGENHGFPDIEEWTYKKYL